jgi:hypothetical protein
MWEELNEPILPDDYKIYGDYLYVVDGKIYRSDWHDITVRQLKFRLRQETGVLPQEIRRCDIVGRRAQRK